MTTSQSPLSSRAAKPLDVGSDLFSTQDQTPRGVEAPLPNRAASQGASEASGLIPEGGQIPRGAPPLDDIDQQALDEALELTFPGSDPVATSQITRIEALGDEPSKR